MTRDRWFSVMGAPNTPRGQSMLGNLSALDAARAGLLSVIVGDYHPAAFAPGIFKLVDIVEGGLSAAIAMATGNAARSAGFLNRGEIAIGQRADLVASSRATSIASAPPSAAAVRL